ncbi:hypothetical protein [Methylocystis sp. JR02]|uniref:tetratricopeptide repeat protein n=1 Tax=Methylocystis sp. JR02 TaxID=3046284 RepID=UPI0024BA931A|nr:hypothetical protein [Methylocystis sp. JR02]MDJ0449266.1 hypothetical protein [Methylocystis sp. JR02]
MAPQITARALRALPERPNLEHLRKEAKQRLKLLRHADPSATLAVAQREVARDYGLSSWRRLVALFRPTAGIVPDVPDWRDHWARVTQMLEARDRGDWRAMEKTYRELIAHTRPTRRDSLEADFAFSLVQYSKKPEEARRIFDRLMRKPTPEIMAYYARFAHMIGETDIDQWEAMLRRAVALGDDAVAFNHYANFLWRERNNRAEAERWFRKAAEMDTGSPDSDAAMRGIYATFLWEGGDPVTAETWFHLAFLKSRMDLQAISSFAAMLTATGRVDAGLALVTELLSHPRLQELPKRIACGFELLGWFLRYAHGDEGMRRHALTEIRARLAGCQPLGRFLDLGRNARAAAAAGHPAADLVAASAKMLQSDAGRAAEALAEVERCPAWRD